MPPPSAAAPPPCADAGFDNVNLRVEGGGSEESSPVSEAACASACRERSGCHVYKYISSTYTCYTFNDVSNVFRPESQSSNAITCVQDDSDYVANMMTLVKADPECYTDSTQTDYTGVLSSTTSGIACQTWGTARTNTGGSGTSSWTNQGSSGASCFTPLGYPGKEIGHHNHCRNPDGKLGGYWCYTTRTGTVWEHCTATASVLPTMCDTQKSNLTEIWGGRSKVPAVQVKHFHWHSDYNDPSYGIELLRWPYTVDRVASIDFALSNDCGNQIENRVILFTTQIHIPVTTTYYFYLKSDDDAKLFINGQERLHTSWSTNADKVTDPLYLSAGPIDVMVAHYNGDGAERVTLSWACPTSGVREQIIPATEFVSSDCYQCEAFRTMPGGLTADLFYSWRAETAEG